MTDVKNKTMAVLGMKLIYCFLYSVSFNFIVK